MSPSRSGEDVKGMIQGLLAEAPEVLKAVQDGYGTVPQLLEDLAMATEQIIDTTQELESGGGTLQYRRCVTMLRSQVGTLRDSSKGSWQKDKIVKTINNVVKQVQQLSTHLEC